MNVKDIANKIKIISQKILNSKKGRIGLITTICCAVAVTAVSVSAIGSLHAESNMVKPKTQSTFSIPTIIEKVQPVFDENFVSSTVASTVSVASSPSTAEESSASTSSSTSAKKSSASRPTQSSMVTHYVQVQTKEESSSSPAANSPTPPSSSHIKNYQGVNKQKTYTDEITGYRESVQFLGVGAGYQEVAIAEIQFQTSAAMGAAHYGVGTATLTGPVSHSAQSVVYKTGEGDLFTVSNLTAGTYEVKLTAHDGTNVARFHITVDAGGLVQ